MLKNEMIKGTVEAISNSGDGILKVEGTTVFVPFCLVGEEVLCKILKVKGGIAFGKLVEVLTPSSSRAKPECPVFSKCGGCSLQHMNYDCELDYKGQAVKNNLKKIGGLDVEISAVVASKNYRYRNKLTLPIGQEKGRTVCGFYREHSHDIVPISDCAIQSEWVKTFISAVEKFSEQSGYSGYDEKTLSGELRHLVVREITGKFIVAIVATKNISLKIFDGILKGILGENYTLLLNVNSRQTNAIFGQEWHICRGEGTLLGEEGGIFFKAGANTFVQVNDGVRSKLYNAVLDSCKGFDVALDLYSGGGLLTAMLAKACGVAYGVEIVPEATRCADELKELNGIENMFNICGKVEEKIDELIKKTAGKNRVIVCDPPRKGMERTVVEAVKKSSAERVILISCNSATLARDVGILCGTLVESDGELLKSSPDGTYSIESCTVFDMFPQTPNTETLVVLSKKLPTVG